MINFDAMIDDMIRNKKLSPIVTEIFTRSRKLNSSIAFITQSYCELPKEARVSTTYFFIMKIPNKRELQPTAINHSSDIDFKDFLKCTAEKYSFLVNDTTLPLDNPLGFRKNLLKWIYNKITIIDDQIKDKKLQYDINREAAKISAWSSGRIHKHKHLTGEEILPSNQKQIIKQASLLILLWKKLLENKQKQLKIHKKNRLNELESMENNSLNPVVKKSITYLRQKDFLITF